MEEVILVNNQDQVIGTMEKMEAHEKALLHRAFSIFIFNEKGEMLIHQRADSKYHSGGLWTNACCSHPRKDESTIEAAHRRLLEEMGFDCPVEERYSFIYKAQLDHGLTEHEFDHVFFGRFDGMPVANSEEVKAWKYINLNELKFDVEANPQHYTEWFKIAMAQMEEAKIKLVA